MPFLTLEDPNAKVRGSRDPLGTVPIWSAFARHVVTNITSVSSSVRGFTTLLLGRYFAARLIEDGTLPAEEALNVVLRTEQAAAYARHVAHSVEDDIRGIERVKRFLAEGRGKVTIQADRRGLILSDQKVYGLWGLYSVAARRSGLLTDGTFGVTPIARTFIEQHYTKHLNGAEKPFLRLVAGGGTLTTHADDPVFAALARILPPAFTAPEIEFYGRQLRDAHTDQATEGPTRQQRFSRLLELHTNLETPINREEVRTLATAAASTDETLATSLDRIIHLESILAPAAAVFDFVLTRTNQPPAEVGAAIRTRWGHRVPNLDPHAFEDLDGFPMNAGDLCVREDLTDHRRLPA